METDYPFVIGNKVVKISANGIKNAIDRVTSRHQNKLINITHARNMDLISAKVEAAKQSRTEKRKVYIIVDEKTGECELNHAPLNGVYTVYNNGSEIALETDAPLTEVAPIANKNTKRKIPAQSEKAIKLISKNSKETVMATPAKKAPAKKAAAKKEAKPKDSRIGKATTLLFTVEQWKKIDAIVAKGEESIREMAASAMVAKYKL